MSGWIIYHPKRQASKFDDLIVYHDKIRGNQDPYVWNEQFLHSFCHITEMSPEEGDLCFWVSGDHFPKFTKLFCDLVFVIKEKCFWKSVNRIDNNDAIVESPEAFKDHYHPGSIEHHFVRRKTRFTLKAHPSKSFQPQLAMGQLIDVLPTLQSVGVSRKLLREGLRKGFGSKPMPLNKAVADALYLRIHEIAVAKINGLQLQHLRKRDAKLWSGNLGSKEGRRVKITKCC